MHSYAQQSLYYIHTLSLSPHVGIGDFVKPLIENHVIRNQKYEYKIKKVLGQGSYGITYLVIQKNKDGLEREVALKEYAPCTTCGNLARKESGWLVLSQEGLDGFCKFELERRLLTQLDIPGVVKAIDVFNCNGTGYYAMEFLSYVTLKDYVREFAIRKIPLPPQESFAFENNKLEFAIQEKEALSIFLELREVVNRLHQEGVFHCDIKLNNIVRASDGKWVIVDLGSSVVLPTYTNSNINVEEKDLQDLSLILYQMLTGEYYTKSLSHSHIEKLVNMGVSKDTVNMISEKISLQPHAHNSFSPPFTL